MALSESGLFDTYLAKRAELVRFFAARLKSDTAAEDLVQEIYLRIDRSDPKGIGDPAAFLYRIGWNLMLDQIRSGRRALTRETEWRALETVSQGSECVDQAPAADAALDARQRLERLTRKLNTLSPQTKRAFSLHKFEGLSHAETAARMGISRSAVEKHISAALKALAEREP